MKLDRLLKNRNQLFWILNILGWGGYVSTGYISALTHDKPDPYLKLILASAAMGFVLSIGLRLVGRRLWRMPGLIVASGTLLVSYLFAVIWCVATNLLYLRWVESDWQPEHLLDYLSGVMSSFYILLCWLGLYFGIRYYQQLQKQTEQTLRANAAAHEAQLTMLRYQLNPHFLFNTLNAISTLILDRANETANLTISRLSDFLRYTLDNDPKNQVTLRKELEALDLYLEIEKVRFGNRLTVQKAIQTAALDAMLPSLILQPLVENAIKYAITPSERGGTLKLGAKIHDDDLLLTIADDGPGLSTIDGTKNASCGVGLRNTRERLQQLFGNRQALTLAPNDPQGLVVTINLPYQTSE